MNNVLSDNKDWDELMGFIADGDLTPIIGKELYTFKENGILMPLEDLLSKKILESYNCTDQPPLSLSNAVKYLVHLKEVKSIDLIRKLKSIVKEINLEFPVMEAFLGIDKLNYFINTTVYNNVLDKKLGDQKKQHANTINFSMNEPFSDSENLDKLTEPFIFNVFGSLLETVDPALSEDDMLEFIGSFKEKMKDATNIINALKNKNLLFIGCSFPDWIVRFLLRQLSNEPLTEWGTKRNIIVVNDQSDLRKSQFEFLHNYDVVTYERNTDDFVHELVDRWKKRAPQNVKSRMVFLSYTVKDKEAVETLKKNIETIGNVTCWYDNREIVAGDDFKTEIAKNIKSADLFIPLISGNSLMHKDGYVQLEWFTADNVNTFRKIDGNMSKYLMPIVIDDTNPYDANVPKYFSELSIGKVPAGNPDPSFLLALKETLNLA
jgi:hypothetical protein